MRKTGCAAGIPTWIILIWSSIKKTSLKVHVAPLFKGKSITALYVSLTRSTAPRVHGSLAAAPPADVAASRV